MSLKNAYSSSLRGSGNTSSKKKETSSLKTAYTNSQNNATMAQGTTKLAPLVSSSTSTQKSSESPKIDTDSTEKYSTLGELANILKNRITNKTSLSDTNKALSEWYKNTGAGKVVTAKQTGQNLKDVYTQNANAINTSAVNYAKEHPVTGTALSSIMRLGSAKNGLLENLYSETAGDKLTNDYGSNAINKTSTNMRNAISENMSNGGKLAYSGLNSIIDMGEAQLLNAVIPGAGPVVMGLEKAEDTSTDAIDRGLTNGQIAAEAVLSGVSTALTEKIPMGKIEEIAKTGFQGVGKDLVKSVLKTVGASALSEGVQEMSEDAVDAIADQLVAQDKASLNAEAQALVDKGYSKKDAVIEILKDWIGNAAIDGLMGAATGGLLAGGAGVVNRVGGNVNQNVDNINENVDTINENVDKTPLQQAFENQTAEEEKTPLQQAFENTSEDVVSETTPLQQAYEAQTEETPLQKAFNEQTVEEVPETKSALQEAYDTQAPVEETAVEEPKVYDDKKVSNKDLNKTIDDITKMFTLGDARDTNKAKLKQLINEYEETGNEETYNQIVELLAEIESHTQGNTYTTQKSKKKGQSGKLKTYSYPTNWGTLTENVMSEIDKTKNYNKSIALNNEGLNESFTTSTKKFAELASTDEEWEALNNYKVALNDAVNNPNEETFDKAVDAAGNLGSIVPGFTDEALNMFNEVGKAIGAVNEESENVNKDVDLNDDEAVENDLYFDNSYNTNETKASQTSENSYTGTSFFGATEEAMNDLKQRRENGEYDVDVKHNADTQAEAEKRIKNNRKEVIYSLMNATSVDPISVAETEILINEGINEVADGDYSKLQVIAKRLNANVHKAAQSLQQLAYYAKTAAGVVQKTNAIVDENTEAGVKRMKGKKGKEKLANNSKLASALAKLGTDSSVRKQTETKVKTDAQLKEEVKGTLAREFSSVEDKFSDSDIDKLVQLVKANNVSTEELANEVEQFLKHGDFYTVDESTEVKKAKSTKLANALKATLTENEATETVPKLAKSHDQVLEEVRNTLDDEYADMDYEDFEVEYLARMIEQGATQEELTNALNAKLVNGYMCMSNEDMQAIVDLFNEADYPNLSSKEKYEKYQQAYAIAAKYVGNASFNEKWNAWRYMAMLGNPKTMLRNIIGNSGFGFITNVKDNVAALIETAWQNSGHDIQRTKSVLNPVNDANLITSSKEDFDNSVYEEAARGGDKYNMRQEIEGNKQVFNNKALETARTGISAILEKSDIAAMKNKYSKALAGFLKANGYDSSIFTSTDEGDIEFLSQAREYALQQAKVATFHEDSQIANALSQFSKNLAEGGLAGKAGNMIVEGILPFKKTPANILKQGIKYSPASFLSAVMDVKNGADANAVINDISTGLTGSTILALGAVLASRGLLQAQQDDEEDPYNKASDFALVIGDKSYTLDWLAPGAMPLFVGATIAEELSTDGLEISDMLDVMASIGEPVVEMSMLQGLENTITSIRSGISDKNSMATILGNIGAGYVSQVIPTLAGQVARSIDPYRRSTSTVTSSTEHPFLNSLEYQGRKMLNKIPGLSFASDKYYDVWGNEVKNEGLISGLTGSDSNILDRLAYNMFSPGYISDLSETAEESGLEDLQQYMDSGSVIPDTVSRNYKGERLDSKSYIAYQKAAGTELNNAVKTALSYKGQVDNEVLAKYTDDLETFSRAVAQSKALGYDIANSTAYKTIYSIYKNSGYKGVMEYYIERDKYTANGLSSSSKTAKSFYESFGDEGLEVLGQIKESTGSYSNASSAYSYLASDSSFTDEEKGQMLYELSSGESATKAYDKGGYSAVYDYYTIKANADADGNGSLKKSEIVDYLKSLNFTDSQINTWLDVFGKKPMD